MAEIDQHNRTIRVKIVYYGPPLGGKTTNLRGLHARAVDTHRGEMISINSFQDRTILFDLLPFTAVGPRGFDLRLQLLAGRCIPPPAAPPSGARTAWCSWPTPPPTAGRRT